MYTVRMSPAAMRGLRSIPSPIAGYVSATIQRLAYNPQPPGCDSLGENKYRISEWGWIVEYEIHDKEIYILVFYVG